MRIIVVITFLFFATSCKEKIVADPFSIIDPYELLNKMISTYGGTAFNNSTISYDVNGVSYRVKRRDHLLNSTLTREANGKTYVATYSNGHIEYFIDGVKQKDDTYKRFFFDVKLDAFIYLNSIPHVLNQNAVILKTLPDPIKNNGLSFSVIHVSFKDDSNNEIYLYVDNTTNLLAFSVEKYGLQQTNPVLKEFRNFRYINGLLFADYSTFSMKENELPIEVYFNNFINGNMEKIEDYNFKNIEVILKN